MYGTPTEKTWPGITKLQDFKLTFPQFKAKGLGSFNGYLDEAGLDLLSKMIVYDPCKRISAKSALTHVNIIFYFSLTSTTWINLNSYSINFLFIYIYYSN
jgi:serine/threonine protein kinase